MQKISEKPGHASVARQLDHIARKKSTAGGGHLRKGAASGILFAQYMGKAAELMESTGRRVVGTAEGMRDAFEYFGRVVVALWRLVSHPRSARLPDFAEIFLRAGADAVPVTMLIGLLLGFIVSYMSATMLDKFGAEIYVANLIGVSVMSELGAIVASIVLAARSASAFAAELGTMVVNDEVAALKTMGIEPVGHLALPRIVAGAAALPLLTLFADLAGLIGGYVLLAAYGYSLPIFLRNAFAFCTARGLATSLFKSCVFGALIAGVGCRRGLETGVGADAVGRSTTSAVVSAIVLFVAADGAFAILLSLFG